MKGAEKIRVGGRMLRRFILPGQPVRDGTVRCVFCGQIDDHPFHDNEACPATAFEGEK